MTEDQHSMLRTSDSNLSPQWQVYVYYKVKLEDKDAVIEHSLRLGRKFEQHGVNQSLKIRVDSGPILKDKNTHTLMEVYSPSDCKNEINLNEFLQLLQEYSQHWAMDLNEPPLRVTEVFIDIKGH